MKLKKKLSQRVYNLCREAAQMSGSTDPDDNMYYIEEELDNTEWNSVFEFFKWLHKTGMTFGSNIPEVYQDFYNQKGQ